MGRLFTSGRMKDGKLDEGYIDFNRYGRSEEVEDELDYRIAALLMAAVNPPNIAPGFDIDYVSIIIDPQDELSADESRSLLLQVIASMAGMWGHTIRDWADGDTKRAVELFGRTMEHLMEVKETARINKAAENN